MTTLLATERIKLFTTRSPWWSAFLALGLTIGFAGLVALNHNGGPLRVEHSQFGIQFGLMVVTVMAALAITTEYRFATIRATFQAVPNRTSALLAKTTVVAVLAAVIGEVAAFGSWATVKVIDGGGPELAITTGADWRMVAGAGLVFGIAAVIAVAVGTLVRQSAGAISILLIWPLLVENLVQLIPGAGDDIHNWMPFTVAGRFLNGPGPDAPLSAWGSLFYFAAVAAVLLLAAITAVNKRDA
ncbi:hypothetical protein [Actinokineospora diospyrosa]|uniref:ABC-2 type transport system permease protein n=1 Tax=Actinokineospora diospyrosa TaxID=103728 RepID=A0ABT1ICN0_9PSEU|nr:hypothetical protein [Actinokineospora diospyrosa]MCP2270333.1 ABC-2 type transport system permease protein [Actinokineospora diospyrosa]